MQNKQHTDGLATLRSGALNGKFVLKVALKERLNVLSKYPENLPVRITSSKLCGRPLYDMQV